MLSFLLIRSHTGALDWARSFEVLVVIDNGLGLLASWGGSDDIPSGVAVRTTLAVRHGSPAAGPPIREDCRVTSILASAEELAGLISTGASVAVPRDQSGCAMDVVRALVRRPVRDLRLIAVPQAGLQADLLIGAGCVRSVEAAAVTLGEFGAAPRFRAAVSEGAVEIRDSTCPAIHAGLQAAEKGVPFMPLRGILGSDLEAYRDDWCTIENPYAEGDPILLLPAISPDVSLFHASRADRDGNVWIGVNRELLTMAHASRETLVTVETFSDENLLADERLAAGTVPSLYVSALAEAPRGAAPVGLAGQYEEDGAHLRRYAELAQTDEGFDRYLAEHVLNEPAAA